MSSPKRKSYELEVAETGPSKKAKLSSDEDSEASKIAISNSNVAPDSLIDHKAAIADWSGTEATTSKARATSSPSCADPRNTILPAKSYGEPLTAERA
ncbi:hypothetical protein LTR81_027072 [Elasticomyces elasticus]